MARTTDRPRITAFPPAAGWTVAAASRTGSRRRVNEDGWLVLADARPLLLAVADGVGGEAAGEEASATAVAALEAAWRTWRPAAPPDGDETRTALLTAAQQADAAVLRLGGSPHAHGAATTLTAIAVGDGYLAIVHAGDSRAYRISDGKAVQLTADHTWLAEHATERSSVSGLPAAGTGLDSSGAGHGEAPPAQHPMRHVITRYLGQEGGCPFDALTVPRGNGDGLLLCTDGVTNVVALAEIVATVGDGSDPDDGAGAGAASDEAPKSASQRGGLGAPRYALRPPEKTILSFMTSVRGSNAAGQVERLLDIVAARDGSDDATLVVAWPAPVAPVDPFGLHRLLERPQSRRRPLLAGVVAVGAGVAAMGVAGAWLAPRVAETLLPPNRPPPGPLAAEYLQRWQDGDLGALYQRLTPAAQAALDRDTFIRRHQAFGAELTLTGLNLTLNLTPGATPVAGTQPGASAGVAFDAVYTTARFGELRRQNTLPLEWRDGRWGVSWTPAVLLPELSAGRTVRAFSDPAARGAILERQGRPLAVTSAESATSGTRQYPQGTVAGPLTGYVGEVTAAELAGRAKDGILAGDRVGKAGLEGAADALLAGQRGGRLTILTPNGEIATTLSSVPPRAGETVRLTLDLDLQRELEAALDGRAGSIVVLNPQDGSIRALATYPRYDPNAFTSGETSRPS
ncbi:MAG: protein phosphatase 2C domain-containing protein [Chloroflexota bacterium]|nr:protein phosphatase 2C domain-containing protein [Chloroflexota bacterium]